MHQHDRHATLDEKRQHRGIVAQRRHVVDDARPGIEAGRATGARLVSTDTITFFAAKPFDDGQHARSSSSIASAAEPGRSIHRPTSTKSAPSETETAGHSWMACAASSVHRRSEKESGVT